ncbi:hypothetical protein FA13DRAFT_1736056, partial [Coprinellus micaceus]
IDVENQCPNNPYDRALRAICNVCKLWSTAAEGEPILWTKFPTFEFGKLYWGLEPIRRSLPTHLRHQGKTVRRLERYISHSGKLRFTFGFVMHHDVHLPDAYVSFARTVLRHLVEECHRWEGAMLYLARSSAGGRWPADLAMIKGRLPVLSSLNLTVAAQDDAEWPMISSLFADAPKLRRVVFNPPRQLSGGGKFNITLPWSQLETFEGLSYLRVNDSFFKLLSNCRDTLTSLKGEVEPSVPHTLPATTLTKLTTLHLRLLPENTTLRYLDSLTLPALGDLELRGDSDWGDPLYSFVQPLVERSRCELRRLVLAIHRPYPPKGKIELFKRFLEQCHLLTDLDIPCFYVSDPQSLRCLAVDSNLETPSTPRFQSQPAPNLERLTLRSDGRDDPSDWLVDPAELMRVVTSRTGIQGTVQLQEVRFVHSSRRDAPSRRTWMSQLDLVDHSRPLSVPGTTKAERQAAVQGWEVGLRDCFCRSFYFTSEFLNIVRQREMSTFLRGLEEYSLDGCDSQILAVSFRSHQSVTDPDVPQRRGIPRLLDEIGRREGAIPGDKLFHFRKRAAELCRKWRPKLLRDYRLSSYRWYRLNDFSATLKYVPLTADGEYTLWGLL